MLFKNKTDRQISILIKPKNVNKYWYTVNPNVEIEHNEYDHCIANGLTRIKDKVTNKPTTTTNRKVYKSIKINVLTDEDIENMLDQNSVTTKKRIKSAKFDKNDLKRVYDSENKNRHRRVVLKFIKGELK